MVRPETPATGFTNLEDRAVSSIMAFSPHLRDLATMGQGWYDAANSSVRAVARAVFKDFGHNVIHLTAGVMAILSPQMKWEDTMVDAYVLLKEELQGVPRDHSFMAIGRNVSLARRYLVGEYEPQGPKVKAFTQNLEDPRGWGPVTLDGRMAKVLGVDPSKISKGPDAIARYDALSRAFIRVAQLEELESPQALQAGIWMMDRARHKQKGRSSGPR